MKKTLKTATAICIALAAMFASCKDNKVKIEGLDLAELDNLTVAVGETITKTAKVTPANYNSKTDEYSITSSNPNVATVTGSAQGNKITVNVTGVSPGKSNIAIKHNASGLLQSREVTVLSPEATLATIAVSGELLKKVYHVDEPFEPAGITVTATYNYGNPAAIAHDKLAFTPADFSKEAANNVTITVSYTYKDVTKSAEIKGISVVEVSLTSIAVSGEPTKKVYEIGEPFNPTGLTVTATYSNGSTAAIPHSELDFDTDFSNEAGANKTVTVSFTYKGKTETAEITGITVNEPVPVLQSISVNWITEHKNFGIGEPLNSAEKAWTVTADYGGGKTETIQNDDPELTWTLANFSETAGTNKSVTVTYKENTTQITGINVLTLPQRITAATSGATIILYTDEEVTSNISINKKITLASNSRERTIKITTTPASGGVNNIDILNGGNLTLDTCVTIDGTNLSKWGSLVGVQLGGMFTMKEDSKITGGNCTYGSYSGGVSVSGIFNMEGGIITGNTAGSQAGSGVTIYSTGVMNMSGGKVINNPTTRADILVTVAISPPPVGQINISGNAEIGSIALIAGYWAPGNAEIKVAGMFTGSVNNIDLSCSAQNSGWWAMHHYLNKAVVTAGEGVTLSKDILDKFVLRNFTGTTGVNPESAAGYHIYGTKSGETDTDRFGTVVAD
jgi:hypothetical protein